MPPVRNDRSHRAEDGTRVCVESYGGPVFTGRLRSIPCPNRAPAAPRSFDSCRPRCAGAARRLRPRLPRRRRDMPCPYGVRGPPRTPRTDTAAGRSAQVPSEVAGHVGSAVLQGTGNTGTRRSPGTRHGTNRGTVKSRRNRSGATGDVRRDYRDAATTTYVLSYYVTTALSNDNGSCHQGVETRRCTRAQGVERERRLPLRTGGGFHPQYKSTIGGVGSTPRGRHLRPVLMPTRRARHGSDNTTVAPVSERSSPARSLS